MYAHPAELMLNDIFSLDKEGLIAEILAFNDVCFFDFTPDYLDTLDDTKLRHILLAARRHYRSKGY